MFTGHLVEGDFRTFTVNRMSWRPVSGDTPDVENRIAWAAATTGYVLVGLVLVARTGAVGFGDAFGVLVVPAAFLASAAAGAWFGADPGVSRLVAGIGGLHVGAMVMAAWSAQLGDGAAAALVHVAAQAAYGLGFALFFGLALCYPSGDLARGRRRALTAVAGLAVALPVLGGLAGPSPSVLQAGERASTLRGPLVELLPAGVAVVGAGVLVLPVLGAAVFVTRYLRAPLTQRRRMRWPVLGVVLVAVLAFTGLVLDSSLPPASDVLFLLAAPLLPFSLVLGSSGHPPFEVDRLLRRTAVFGGTWTVAAAAYGTGIAASAWAAGPRGLAAAVLLGGLLSLILATPVRRRLLALADERERLREDLSRQVELLTLRTAELDESRRRMAAAAETERLRIERDLHDGAQQELLAVLAQIEAARTGLRDVAVGQGPAVALERAALLARGAYEAVRSVSHGIRPSVLEDLGLVHAIASRAAHSPVPVTVVAQDGLSEARWPVEIEGAAYFFAQEGLANVLKHAQASEAVAEISYVAGSLVVEVRDNGRGGVNPAHGTGLAGLRDRFEAFGGSIDVREAGGWTRLRAELPTGTATS